MSFEYMSEQAANLLPSDAANLTRAEREELRQRIYDGERNGLDTSELLKRLQSLQEAKPTDHFDTSARDAQGSQSKHWLFGKGSAGVAFGNAMKGTDLDTFAWHVATAAYRAGFRDLDFGKLRSRIADAVGGVK